MILPVLKTLRSLFDTQLVLLLIACALLAVAVIISAGIAITWLTATFITFQYDWLDTTVNVLAGIVSGIGGWFMLPVLIVLIGGIFQEKIIHRVEQLSYPDSKREAEPKLWPDFVHDLLFTVRALLLNLLILPTYFFAVGPLIAIALNSYLLGREFFESAAGYHLGKPAARKLGKEHAKTVYGGGLIITCLSLLPMINLIAPVVATIWMVHAYHGLAGASSIGQERP
ncbi:MAG: EI24 domain-containing protein [Pelovirga sp.]